MKTFSTTLIGFLIVNACMFSSQISAAISDRGRNLPPPPTPLMTNSFRESVIQALKQPLPVRITQLQSAGDPAFRELEKMAFDKEEDFRNRWRAITSIGQINPQAALKPLEQALTSDEWFVRNAAMISIAYGDRSVALKWARRLLNDKALVVRTAAVQAIAGLSGKELTADLWEKLYAKENFRGSQSLWIRRHIVQVLSRFPRPQDKTKFIALLKDPDKSLYKWAIAGLEKLTGQFLNHSKEPIAKKRELWLAWANKTEKILR